jgi:hypothetical protein
MRINKKSVENVAFRHALEIGYLTERLDRDHLAAFIETARRADPMRHEWRGTL